MVHSLFLLLNLVYMVFTLAVAEHQTFWVKVVPLLIYSRYCIDEQTHPRSNENNLRSEKDLDLPLPSEGEMPSLWVCVCSWGARCTSKREIKSQTPSWWQMWKLELGGKGTAVEVLLLSCAASRLGSNLIISWILPWKKTTRKPSVVITCRCDVLRMLHFHILFWN